MYELTFGFKLFSVCLKSGISFTAHEKGKRRNFWLRSEAPGWDSHERDQNGPAFLHGCITRSGPFTYSFLLTNFLIENLSFVPTVLIN